MQALCDNCIFCGRELPSKNERGLGEHVIPKCIYGSIKIKDVCRECNSKLGSEVDHLILEDPRIINAINELELPDLQRKLLEKAKTIGRDTIDGHEIKFKYDKNGFKPIPTEIAPNKFIFSDLDALPIISKMAKRRSHTAFTKKEIDYYVKNILLNDYQNLEFG